MPPKLPVLTTKEVVAASLRAGFYIHHQKESHARLFHRTKPGLHVTVPVHSKDIPPTLLKHRIPKQARIP
jgi:predicted RNA binding protein YcfA (HicA-like mRNA interferase family)